MLIWKIQNIEEANERERATLYTQKYRKFFYDKTSLAIARIGK